MVRICFINSILAYLKIQCKKEETNEIVNEKAINAKTVVRVIPGIENQYEE